MGANASGVSVSESRRNLPALDAVSGVTSDTAREHALPQHRPKRKIRNPKSEIVRGPADVLDHATSEIAIGLKLGIDATKKLAGEGFKRPWPTLIKMSEDVRKKIDSLFGGSR
jgi:hypothetical protein